MREVGIEHVLYRFSGEGGIEWLLSMESDFVDLVYIVICHLGLGISFQRYYICVQQRSRKDECLKTRAMYTLAADM